LAWYEVDLNWYGIWILQKLGLARQVYAYKLSSREIAAAEKAEQPQATAMVPTEPASDLISV